MTLIASEPVDQNREIPELPLALGLAGLAPFLGLSLALALGHALPLGIDAADALLGYGAAILSFLGGAHWGLALRHPSPAIRNSLFLLAVAPPLWAWGALVVGGAPGLAMLAAGLAAHGALDATRAPRSAAPRWYARLRLLLAALATIATTAAAVVVGYA
ncbi:DUF3429 domain-containing protein [Methylopila henanensis]|uniref:DUF3429 domain-containing protein n=1 Tax=Methylopila henanensis TaxID=873516 RepID=A0ABW4KA08_9HYPH